MIAQAFAKRKTFNNDGRLSISFCNTHEDPVGLNFGQYSVASQALSSTWAAALPKLVTRRGAYVDKQENSYSVSSNRRNSVDSEIISFRRVSVESRRNSLDSQISVKIEELKTTRKVASSRNRRDRDKRRRDFKSRSSKVGPLFRRGSTTSQESQLGTQILNALSADGTFNVPAIQMPNMNRRSACSGNEIPKLLDAKTAGKLLPFLLAGQSDSDENLSSEGKNESFRHTGEAKCIDLDAGDTQKDDQESDSDSNLDEETKMLEATEEPQKKRSKSNENGRRSREGRKSKYMIQDESALKHLLQDSSDIKVKIEAETKDNNRKGVIGDLASNLTPYCQELVRTQIEGSTNAREIATQTSVPLDILEMEELKQSIDEIINNRKKI